MTVSSRFQRHSDDHPPLVTRLRAGPRSVTRPAGARVAYAERQQLFPCILERIPVPLELIPQHTVRLGQYRVRNVDADVSGPRVADDYGRRAAEMQRPDIDAGIERSADHSLVKFNFRAAQLGIRQSDGRCRTL